MKTMRTGQITAGALLIAAGVLLFGMQMGLWTEWPARQWWPVLLILIGLAQLLQSNDGNRFGVLVMSSGAILLMHTTGVLSLRTSWPLFIVANGLYVLLTAGKNPKGRKGAPHAD